MTSPSDDELGLPADATLSAVERPAVLLVTTAAAGGGGGATSEEVKVSSSSSSSSTAAVLSRSSAARRCLLVGRQAATADLRIRHGSISRRHAALYYDAAENLFLKDLGGRHGTTVNGVRIDGGTARLLRDGDEVQFGNVRESVFVVRQAEKAAMEQNKTAKGSIEAREESEVAKDMDAIEKAGEGLTGRARRQAEIAAMMASLDETPTYRQYHQASAAEETEKPSSEEPPVDDEPTRLARKHGLPVTESFTIDSESDRRHAVSCLAVDPAGSRFAVGSTDAQLRLYDFGGMSRGSAAAFGTVAPDAGHWPVSLSYSNTGDRLLVGTAGAQPVVLDREGGPLARFVRGDAYLADQSRTAGHTAAVTGADWHPLERDSVLTGSGDGTARLWDVSPSARTRFGMLCCRSVLQARSVRGRRTAVASVCFHPGGREFAVGTACGSIQVWSATKASSSRPVGAVFGVHDGKPVSALRYSQDGTKLASRSHSDDAVAVWKTRLSRSSVPTVVCRDAGAIHEPSNVAFSPDGKILCVPTSATRQGGATRQDVGALKFYDVSGDSHLADPLVAVDMPQSPVVVSWHPKINQIFVGCSDGQTVVYFDPQLSTKGAVQAAAREGKRVDELSELLRSKAPTGSAAYVGEIITPLAQARNKKRRREEKEGVAKTHEPERPATGKHKAGGQAGGATTFQQFVADQTIVQQTKAIAGKDPREALFQYSEGKAFIESAYEGNKRPLADRTAEEEEEESKTTKI
jgi:WD40 repeat protein/pSer/pThr/pTyr-binding forkhead associated (FHA) protein